MLLRPFLNDAGSCASYLFGCTDAQQARGRRPARRSRRRLPRGGRRDRRADRRGVRDACAGRPRLRSAGARRAHRRDAPTCPPAPASSSSISRSPTARWSSSATRRDARSRPRDTRPPITPTRSPTGAAARGAVARVQRRLAADRRRRPARPARRRRRRRPGAAAAREPARGCSSCPTMSCSTRATTRGSVCGRGLSGNPFSSIGFERAPQPDARVRRPRRVRRRAARRHAAAARRAGADRRRQPLAAGVARTRVTPRRRLGLRANARQFALLVGAERARRRHGRPRAQRAAARRQAGLRARARPRRSSPSSSPSAPPRRSPTSPPASSPNGSGASGCWCSAGWSRCRCRC